jgi:riboflavin-specific deaminase-like protein
MKPSNLHRLRNQQNPKPADRSAPRPPDPLPSTFINMSMSADGKIASSNREISSFGSPTDQKRLLQIRARAHAVMAGARTVDGNPVTLEPGPAYYRRLRLRRGLPEYNLRVVVSGTGTLHPDAELFRHTNSPIIILTTDRIGAQQRRRLESVATEVRICGDQSIDFPQTLRWLRQKWGVEQLLCEGGGELNAALLRAGLVTRLFLTICPLILGGRKAPTLAGGLDPSHLGDSVRLHLDSTQRKDGEIFLEYEVIAAPGPLACARQSAASTPLSLPGTPPTS